MINDLFEFNGGFYTAVFLYSFIVKLIPTDLWSPETSMEIVENEFVRIISSKDLQATVIDNKRVAKAMKQIFDMIWSSGLGRDYK